VLGGREVRVAWRILADADAGGVDAGGVRARVDAALAPLVLRGWRAGDRMRTGAGTKKLKKLLGERRVPLSARRRLPVLATPQGRVVWAAGVAQDPSTLPREGAAFLLISIG
ncbi:MAG TPA: tRNA lysidine(34) synthetase TilS, partial [Longimicrobiaceae bacterium]|nr:tRNA lysidine(34) synthetase TilS [Longimicrobiaceae bacterium]